MEYIAGSVGGLALDPVNRLRNLLPHNFLAVLSKAGGREGAGEKPTHHSVLHWVYCSKYTDSDACSSNELFIPRRL